MPHLSYDQKTIQQKLKLMTHYDIDQQYMAATDLSQSIEKFHQKISPQNISRIINALLLHLKNQSTELHGNAIKCLSKIISKLPIEESKRVCGIMINNIISESTNSEVRDIYGTCVKTIINDVGLTFGQHIKDLLKLAIEALLNTKQKRVLAIDQELVDIITPFMKKWPKQVEQLQLPRNEFIKYLLQNILINKEPILRKRSYICLGVFSNNFTIKELELTLLDIQYGLLKHFVLNSDYEKKKVIIHSILAVLKSGNVNLQCLSEQLLVEIIKNINLLKSIDDLSKCEKIYELLESGIQCLVNLVKIKPSLFELGSTYCQSIYDLCEQLVEYSPYGDIQKVSDMQVEQDEYQQQDTQDSSFKVRKNIILLIVEIGSINESLFKKYIKIKQLYDRFEENQPQIIQTLINGFFNLFSSYTKQTIEDNENIIFEIQQVKFSKRESLVSVIENLLDILIKHLSKIMDNTNLHESIIVSASKLINFIGRLFTNQIVNNESLTHTYLDVAYRVLSKTKSNEVKIDLLNFFQSILRSIKTKVDCNRLADLFIKSTRSNIYKVSSSAFKTIQALLSTGQFVWFQQLGNVILQRLKETDIDQDIKNSVIGCTSEMLQKYPHEIPINYLEQYLSQLLNKLGTEIEKRHTISAIWKINLAIPLNPKIIQTLNSMISQIAKIGLNIVDNVMRIKSCEAIQTLFTILNTNSKKQIVQLVLQSSKQIFKDRVYPLFLTEIIKVYPQSIIRYLPQILILNDLPTNTLPNLLSHNLITTDKLLAIVQTKLSQQSIKNIIKVISTIDIDIKQLENLNDSKLKQQLIIGYLGSKRDPNNFDLFMKIVLDQTKNDHLRLESSSALGALAASNVEEYLLVLLKQINNRKDNYYLINAIKHLVINSTEKDEKSLLSLQLLLFKISHVNQSSLIALAQSIGLIVKKLLVPSYNNIMQKLKSNDSNTRLLACSSYRYFANTSHSQTGVLQKYIAGLLPLLNDQNLSVRSAVVKSLNTIVFYSPNLLITFITQQFFSSFNKLLQFKEDLVEIVDYGSSKEKIDRGKIIRIQGFSFFETLLDKATLSQNQVDHMIVGCLSTIQIDTSIDVVIIRLQLLKRILNINIKLFKQSEQETAKRLGVTEGKLKQYKDKTQITDPKIDKIITLILFILLKLAKNSTKDEVKKQLENIKLIPLYSDKIKESKA